MNKYTYNLISRIVVGIITLWLAIIYDNWIFYALFIVNILLALAWFAMHICYEETGDIV